MPVSMTATSVPLPVFPAAMASVASTVSIPQGMVCAMASSSTSRSTNRTSARVRSAPTALRFTRTVRTSVGWS
jgi:hypothetical protein